MTEERLNEITRYAHAAAIDSAGLKPAVLELVAEVRRLGAAERAQHVASSDLEAFTANTTLKNTRYGNALFMLANAVDNYLDVGEEDAEELLRKMVAHGRDVLGRSAP